MKDKNHSDNSASLNPIDHCICLMVPELIDERSAWIEHIPFAFVLIDLLRPDTFVELGTHTGVSYCAFCQAVSHLDLLTKCYAVDTWEGDNQTGLYPKDVYLHLNDYNNEKYGNFSFLIKSTFDEASIQFPDGSIDLLHIDGLHTYEAVKHDFKVWLPKMSHRGIILLHDTNEREADFGVWKLWDEYKHCYPSFEFLHEHGLGVLGVGKDVSNLMRGLFNSSSSVKDIRSFFSILGERQRDRLYIYEQEKTFKDSIYVSYSQKLASDVKDAEIQRMFALLADSERQIIQLNDQLSTSDNMICELTNRLAQSQTDLLLLTHEAVKYELSRSWAITRPFRKIKKCLRGK